MEAGADLSPHQVKAIQESAKNNQIDMIKYLVHFFKDKEEAWNHIVMSSHPMDDDLQLAIAYDDTRKETNEELRKYIDFVILEETLQKELNSNNTTPQRKI